MGSTSLTIGSYTFVFTDSNIESIKETCTSQSENTEIAGAGPMASYNYDYNGSKKIIVIKGQLTAAASTRVSGYTVTTILAQKQWLESLINGSQSAITLTDDFAGQSVYQSSGATPPYNASFTTTKAMVGIFECERQRGNPNMLPFTITLEVGI